MSLIPSFCLVGYAIQGHWVNQEISRVTAAKINHVAFRIRVCNKEYETYVLIKNTDTLVPAKYIERLFSKPTIQTPWMSCSNESWFEKVIDTTENYGKASIIHSYFYHYVGKHIGMPVPKTCTDLVWRCCQVVDANVKERFYPNKLIKEFYQCML
ncbi:MAG: hypothetical protein CMA63_06250 [Euryarchaeota archaeon]|jgi:hypothetical protein|nr:hypothetical protein [Euryarchaeota archaeon]|tara:strand:+ start:17745 stop:18209 length:465 start_codon:yes stop_codon:yes gene_type:complete